MTLLARRREVSLGDRLDALDRVVTLADGRLDPDAVATARRVAGKAGERLRFGEAHTVVALAGTTGSGKSSLFNALAGTRLSEVGMRRPTTSTAHAAVWGDEDAGALLDWLDVPRRHLVRADAVSGRDEPTAGPGSGLSGSDGRVSTPVRPAMVGAAADGLVLLDLPDVDSVQVSHRLEVDRLAALVDLLVWVLDPQKYADAALHDRYLARLSSHAGVMLIVLNQVDRLSPEARAACLADLRRLLREEGLGEVPVVAVSAVTGEGLDELRDRLAALVAARKAAVQRLEADLDDLAGDLRGAVSGGGTVDARDREALVAALADAAGADVIGAAVFRSHRARARIATGWPFTRWVTRLRPDAVRRLHLPESPNELVRTSLPGASAVQRARVDTALRNLGESAAGDLPEPWPAVLRRTATASRDALPDLLDRAVAGTDLGIGRRPRWWRVANVVQWLLAVTAIVGALWLLALFVVDWLRLPQPPTPDVGILPLPTLLLAGGLLAGLILALLSANLAAIGARRRAARATRRVRDAVRQLATDVVLDPVEDELKAHAALRDAVRHLTR